jgi:hypothetical protein
MEEKLHVRIYGGYGGGVNIDINVNGLKTYVIERDELVVLLEKMITEKGYTTSLKPRQQYPRLKIND